MPTPPSSWTPRPTSAPAQAAVLAAQPRPIVRLQAPEELLPPATPKALVLPSPEQLGVASAGSRTARPLEDRPVDWNVTHDRLNRLGAVRFALAKLPEGVYRIAFELPTVQPGRMHYIEAEGTTEGAAVCRALDLADRWVGQRQ